ncbi:MAG: hypothetical protein HQL24_07125 [Candidatus Omnitrophica bacterium]|nr:hypothetical protein [Candidatus Omnitrophota bacterium]
MTNILNVANTTSIKKKPILFGVGVCAGLYFLSKYIAPFFFQYCYHHQMLGVLNIFSGFNEIQPLDVYLGHIEENFLGPVNILTSTFVFLLIGLLYLESASVKKFWLAVFSFFILTKPEVLLFQPYGETIGGPFMEAVWLKNHAFNYIALAQQPGFIEGGPKVYLFSFFPTLQGILMKFFPNAQLFLAVDHLIVFASGALIVALLREIIQKIAGRTIALLMAVLLLSIPLFQSQIEQLNMEMPATVCAMIAMYYLINKRLGLAGLFSVLAVMAKGVAIFTCGIVFLAACFHFLYGETAYRFKKRTVLLGLAMVAFMLLYVYANFFILNKAGKVDMVGPWGGWKTIRNFYHTYFYIFSFIILIGHFLKKRFVEKKTTVLDFIHIHYVPLVMFLAAGGWFAVFVNSMAGPDRYRLLLIPFNVFCLFYALQLMITSVKIQKWMIITLTVGCLLSAYGLFLHKLPTDQHISDHAFLERSLEYRIDLQFNQRLARTIESKYSQFSVGAPYVLAQILAFPELGYVTKKLNVYIYGFPCLYDGLSQFQSIQQLNLRSHVWVGVPNRFGGFLEQAVGSFPVGQHDKVLEEVYYGDRKAWIFVGGEAIERMKRLERAIVQYITTRGISKNPHAYNMGIETK